MIGYENPVYRFEVGDMVRIGKKGATMWTVVGKGATTGLALKNESGRKRSADTSEVTLVRAHADDT